MYQHRANIYEPEQYMTDLQFKGFVNDILRARQIDETGSIMVRIAFLILSLLGAWFLFKKVRK